MTNHLFISCSLRITFSILILQICWFDIHGAAAATVSLFGVTYWICHFCVCIATISFSINQYLHLLQAWLLGRILSRKFSIVYENNRKHSLTHREEEEQQGCLTSACQVVCNFNLKTSFVYFKLRKCSNTITSKTQNKFAAN